MTNAPTLSKEVRDYLALNSNLDGLNQQQRLELYHYRCHQAGLDPTTQPIGFMRPNGRNGDLILYAKKTASEQLMKIHNLSREIRKQEIQDLGNGRTGCSFIVRISDQSGRYTDEIGCVAFEEYVRSSGKPVYNEDGSKKTRPMDGFESQNAQMKALTKASRRAVLTHTGNTMLDESETDTLPDAKIVELNAAASQAVQETQGGTLDVESMLDAQYGSDEWIAAYEHECRKLSQAATEASADAEAWKKWCRHVSNSMHMEFVTRDDGSRKYVGPVRRFSEFVELASCAESFKMWMEETTRP